MIKKLLKNSLAFSVLMIAISSSNAQTWDVISTPVTTNFILQDIVFPADQSLIGYTGGTNVTYNGKGKVLKTTDGGDTWVIQWESDDSGTGVTSLHFFDTMNGFAGTMSGDIMETIDGGTTWTSSDIDPNAEQGELSDLDFFDDDNGAIVTQWNGIYYTSDGGDTWTVASSNYNTAIDLHFASSSTVFAVGYDQKIYKSEDGGDTWVFSYQGLNGSNGSQYINLGVYFLNSMDGIVTSEEGDYFITSDGGDTWTNSSISTQYGLMRSAYMFNTDDIYVCATPGEVFSTNDGGSAWTSEYYDFAPAFYKITFTSDGTGFVCGSASDGGTILKMDPTGVGIEEMDGIEAKIFPNPANEYIIIKFEALSIENVVLQMTDSQGKIVLSSSISISVGEVNERLDISHLSEGNYLFTLVKENGVQHTSKVQIQR